MFFFKSFVSGLTKSRGYSNSGWLSEGEYSGLFFSTRPSPTIDTNKFTENYHFERAYLRQGPVLPILLVSVIIKILKTFPGCRLRSGLPPKFSNLFLVPFVNFFLNFHQNPYTTSLIIVQSITVQRKTYSPLSEVNKISKSSNKKN